MSTEKLKRYNEWAERCILAGLDMADFECPHCNYLLHAKVPQVGDVYDSAVQCPNCDGLLFKVVKSDGSVLVRYEVDGDLREVPHAQAH